MRSRARRFARGAKGLVGWLRVQRWSTTLFGPQYERSRTKIEIDLTWSCNLKCNNCNRSCTQAPTGERVTVAQIEEFVTSSLQRDVRWEQIRLLGGEPTLHPELLQILSVLHDYQKVHTGCRVVLCTNGYGRRVQEIVAGLPGWLEIENTEKTTPEQEFVAFNIAPKDRRTYRSSNYTNACWVAQNCGMGLTPRGYYPCAVAGGIDRVVGWEIGRQQLPSPEDDMWDILQLSCAMCGGFDRLQRRPVTTPMSSHSWRSAYKKWRG